MQRSRALDGVAGDGSRLIVFFVSIIALAFAVGSRHAIFTVTVSEYGSNLAIEGLVAIIILDGVYISLLLIGLGGMGSLVFTPDDS